MSRVLVALLMLASSGVAGASGQTLFAARCSPCHQPGGEGVPGLYPALKDSVGSYLRAPEGRVYLAHAVSFGMMGTIASRGQTYNGFMQPWTQLTDAEIADLLNYVLVDLNAAGLPHGFVPFTADELHTLRARHLTFDEVHREREALMKALAANPMAPAQAQR